MDVYRFRETNERENRSSIEWRCRGCRYHRVPRTNIPRKGGERRDVNRQSPSTREEMLSRVCARHSSIFHFKSSFTTCLTQPYLPPRCSRNISAETRSRSSQRSLWEAARDAGPSFHRQVPLFMIFPSCDTGCILGRVVPRHLRSLSSRCYSGTGYGVKLLTATRVSTLVSTPFVKLALNRRCHESRSRIIRNPLELGDGM